MPVAAEETSRGQGWLAGTLAQRWDAKESCPGGQMQSLQKTLRRLYGRPGDKEPGLVEKSLGVY